MTLADALPIEQERCRMIQGYAREIGASGAFLVAMIGVSLSRAERAAAAGDVVAMTEALADLRSYKE